MWLADRGPCEEQGIETMRVVLLVLLVSCASDTEFGRELENFCELVTEAAKLHPDDRAARSAYVAGRSDAAVSSKKLMGILRTLAVATKSEREQALADAARSGGLSDFKCPPLLNLYQ